MIYYQGRSGKPTWPIVGPGSGTMAAWRFDEPHAAVDAELIMDADLNAVRAHAPSSLAPFMGMLAFGDVEPDPDGLDGGGALSPFQFVDPLQVKAASLMQLQLQYLLYSRQTLTERRGELELHLQALQKSEGKHMSKTFERKERWRALRRQAATEETAAAAGLAMLENAQARATAFDRELGGAGRPLAAAASQHHHHHYHAPQREGEREPAHAHAHGRSRGRRRAGVAREDRASSGSRGSAALDATDEEGLERETEAEAEAEAAAAGGLGREEGGILTPEQTSAKLRLEAAERLRVLQQEELDLKRRTQRRAEPTPQAQPTPRQTPQPTPRQTPQPMPQPTPALTPRGEGFHSVFGIPDSPSKNESEVKRREPRDPQAPPSQGKSHSFLHSRYELDEAEHDFHGTHAKNA